MNIGLYRYNGLWYCSGKIYATFRDALRAAWPNEV